MSRSSASLVVGLGLAAALAPRGGWACGPDFPFEFLSQRDATLARLPDGTFAIEAERLVPAPAKRFVVTDWGEPEGARDGGGERERALYARGARLWHQGAKGAARQAFLELLALPEAERRAFTLPALYNLARSEPPAEARRRFAHLRELAEAGWDDGLGLAAASLGEEAKLSLDAGDDARAVALYATQASHGSRAADASLLFVVRQLVSDDARLARGLLDPLVQRLVATYLWTRPLESWWTESGTTATAQAVLERVLAVPHLAGADRLAAALFRAGRFEEAERLVAGEDSAIAHWVKAKLLLRKGQREAADAELAHAAEGYSLSEGWQADYTPELRPRQQIELERSILSLAHDDFDGAMAHAMAGCSWEDIAYLGERVLDVEAVKRLVDAGPLALEACTAVAATDDEGGWWMPKAQPRLLRALLARRLVRLGRGREALPYFDEATRPSAEAYVSALEAAAGERAPLAKAERLYQAAKVARAQGMEVLGFEGAPDFKWTDGLFAPEVDPSAPDAGQGAEEARRCAASGARPTERYHYREVASRLAEQAADQVSHRSQAFTALLCHAASYVMWRNPERVHQLWRRAVKEGPLLREPMDFGLECPEPRFVPPREVHRALHLRKRTLAWWGLGGLGVAAIAVVALRIRRRNQPPR